MKTQNAATAGGSMRCVVQSRTHRLCPRPPTSLAWHTRFKTSTNCTQHGIFPTQQCACACVSVMCLCMCITRAHVHVRARARTLTDIYRNMAVTVQHETQAMFCFNDKNIVVNITTNYANSVAHYSTVGGHLMRNGIFS